MRRGRGLTQGGAAGGRAARTRLCRLGAAALLFATAGCSGVHLHDEDRAKTAEAAAAAYEEIDIDALFAAARTNQASLLEAELKAVRDHSEADRNAALAQIAVSGEPLRTVWYEGQFLKRLRELGLDTTGGMSGRELEESVEQVVAESGALRDSRRRLQQTRTFLIENFGRAPEFTRCTPEQDVTPRDPDAHEAALKDEGPRYQQYYDRLVEACDAWQEAHSRRAALFSTSGDVTDALNAKLQAQREIAEARAAVTEVKQALADARTEIEDSKLEAPEKAPSEVLAPLQEKLTKAVGEGAEFAQDNAQLALVADALEQLDLILLAAAGDTQASAELDAVDRSAAYTLAALPELADRVSALARSTQRVPTTALVMVKLDLEARLQALKAKVARQKARKDLQMARFEALIEEIDQYNRWILPFLETLRRDSPGVLDQPLSATTPESRARRVAVAMVSEFAVIQSQAMNDRYAAEYRLIAQDYTLALARERALMARWQAVAGPLIAQQRSYHAGGVKPVDLATLAIALIQTVGIFSIADGVN